MTDASEVGRAMLVMITLIVFGVLMAYAVGMAHDVIVTKLISFGIDGGQGTDWDSTREINIATALLYFVCSLPPIFGIIIFALAVTKRSRRDEYYEAGATYYAEE